MENRMRLELGTFPVAELSFGAETRLDGERLTVDREAVRRLVAEDPTFRGVDIESVRAVRLAGLRVAAYLAECTRELTPPRVDVLDLTVADPALPRVVYVWQVYSLETYGGQYWYGLRLDNLFPTLIHPNEVVDGA